MASKFQKAENKCLFWAKVGGILFFFRWKRLFYLCVFQKHGTYWLESNFLGNEACKIKPIFKNLTPKKDKINSILKSVFADALFLGYRARSK